MGEQINQPHSTITMLPPDSGHGTKLVIYPGKDGDIIAQTWREGDYSAQFLEPDGFEFVSLALSDAGRERLLYAIRHSFSDHEHAEQFSTGDEIEVHPNLTDQVENLWGNIGQINTAMSDLGRKACAVDSQNGTLMDRLDEQSTILKKYEKRLVDLAQSWAGQEKRTEALISRVAKVQKDLLALDREVDNFIVKVDRAEGSVECLTDRVYALERPAGTVKVKKKGTA